MESLGFFVPPSFPLPTGRPNIVASLRSVRNPVLGWSPEIFEGGCYRSRLPGAPLIIADPELAAEVLTERPDEFVHGPLLNRIFAPIWGRGIFTAEGARPFCLSALSTMSRSSENRLGMAMVCPANPITERTGPSLRTTTALP